MATVRVGDLTLHYERTGRGPALLVLHGFTGSGTQFVSSLPALAKRFDVIAVDLIGHGRSDAPPDPERYRFGRCLDDLAAVLDALALERAHCLGYSMGGRLALGLALAHPHRIDRLVLESASPGLDDPRERGARTAANHELADRIEREGIEPFVDAWMAQPLFASQQRIDPARLAAARRARLAHQPIGLANSLRGLGTGAQPSFWGRLGERSLPTLLIAGELDVKFRAIAERMQALLATARMAVVPGTGHATHFEAPEAFTQLVIDFLAADSRGANSRPVTGERMLNVEF